MKILLISYKFPPYPEVGALRWSKLCKYLARLGYIIHVVTIDWREIYSLENRDETSHKNIIIHHIPPGIFSNLRYKKFESRILNGIRNKFFVHFLDKYIYTIDEAQFWDKYLIPYCTQLISKESIKIVIATGAPFSINLHAAALKQLTKIKLIQDLRDLWSKDLYAKFTDEQRSKMLRLENKALQLSDAAVTVTEQYTNEFRSLHPKVEWHTITNGFDPDFFGENRAFSSKKEHFVHLGSISNGREECCEAFFDYIVRNNCFAQSGYKIDFAGFIPKNITNKYRVLIQNGTLTCHGFLPYAQGIALLRTADVALQFNAKLVPQAASTKIYEYAAASKPILSFNFGGEAEKLLTQNPWGLSVNLHRPIDDEQIKSFLCGETYIAFDKKVVDVYSYKTIAKQYADLIQKILTRTEKQ